MIESHQDAIPNGTACGALEVASQNIPGVNSAFSELGKAYWLKGPSGRWQVFGVESEGGFVHSYCLIACIQLLNNDLSVYSSCLSKGVTTPLGD